MANNLIENKTTVHYTVQLQGGLFVKKPTFYNGVVENVEVTNDERNAYVFSEKNTAEKVVKYVNGKLIKHTRTTVVTEVTEEVEVV